MPKRVRAERLEPPATYEHNTLTVRHMMDDFKATAAKIAEYITMLKEHGVFELGLNIVLVPGHVSLVINESGRLVERRDSMVLDERGTQYDDQAIDLLRAVARYDLENIDSVIATALEPYRWRAANNKQSATKAAEQVRMIVDELKCLPAANKH